MKRDYAIGIFLAAVAFAGSAQLSAQENGPGSQIVYFIPDGETVYDVMNHVTWLADANLADQTLPGNQTTFRFGLLLFDPLVALPPGRSVRERQRVYELRVCDGMGFGHECGPVPWTFRLAAPHHVEKRY